MSEELPDPRVGPDFDEDAAIERARIRSAQFHDTYIKPAARESAGTLMSKPVGCQCRTPMPKLRDAGFYSCSRCNEALRVDEKGKPFRRLPGDLDTTDQVNARAVLEVAQMSKTEMRMLVALLPHEKQKKLAALPKKKFEKVARQMIRTHIAVKASEATAPIGPNARRRRLRLQTDMADVVDDIAAIARKAAESHGAELGRAAAQRDEENR